MKLKFLCLVIAICCFGPIKAQTAGKDTKRLKAEQEENKVMSEAYWKLWNPEVQAKIDRDIDQNRKADAVFQLKGMPKGTEVKVEQLSHDFIFGAHIFNFNQLGTKERNQKYKDLYGTLFNSATIAFYWKKFEMQPNRLRFREEIGRAHV